MAQSTASPAMGRGLEGRASGHMTLGEAGEAGEASDDKDGRGWDKLGAPSMCCAQHSPLGLAMMLKAGWKPGQAIGRDPGARPMSLNASAPSKAMFPIVGHLEHSFSVLSF